MKQISGYVGLTPIILQ